MDKVFYAVLAVIMIAEIVIYRIKDKKKRYILLSLMGILLMIVILIGCIILKQKNLIIFMSVLLAGYVISLALIWKRIVNKQ